MMQEKVYTGKFGLNKLSRTKIFEINRKEVNGD